MSIINIAVDTDDYNALTRTSDMLHGLALDVKNDKPTVNIVELSSLGTEVHDWAKGGDTPAAATPPAPTEVPPVAAPPIPSAPAAPVAPEGVELDTAGLPWDSRIHGSKKSKTKKDELWKKKRGADPTYITQVENELRAAMLATPNNPITSEAVIPPSVSMPNTPAAVAVPPAPPAAVAEVAVTFIDLMGKITTAMTANTLTEEQVLQAVNNQGLTSLALLAARPDLVPAVDAALFRA